MSNPVCGSKEDMKIFLFQRAPERTKGERTTRYEKNGLPYRSQDYLCWYVLPMMDDQ